MAGYQDLLPPPPDVSGGGGYAAPSLASPSGSLPGSALWGGMAPEKKWFGPPGGGGGGITPPPVPGQPPGQPPMTAPRAAFNTQRMSVTDALAMRKRQLLGLPGSGTVGPGSASAAIAATPDPAASTPGSSYAAPIMSGAPGGTINGMQRPAGPGWGPANQAWIASGGQPNADSSGLLAQLAQRLGSDSAGRQAQAGTAARYFAGDDPAAAGYASLSSALGGQSSDAKAMNDLRVAIASGDYNFAHQKLLQILQGQQQQAMQPSPIGDILKTLGPLVPLLFA